jgi:NAD(P)H-dependent FMN reductase
MRRGCPSVGAMPNLMIVIASTRPGRGGFAVGQWFAEHARTHGGFDVTVVDLAELNLPLLDEAAHPRLQQYEHEHTKDWSALVAAADAFVFVTPEYNHSFPATLKNALDFLHREWAHKAAGFVSYGGVSAGTRAVVGLKPVVAALSLYGTTAAVNIPFFRQFFDDDGAVEPNEIMESSATALLNELVALESTTRVLRS